jgi:hypothetical protein
MLGLGLSWLGAEKWGWKGDDCTFRAVVLHDVEYVVVHAMHACFLHWCLPIKHPKSLGSTNVSGRLVVEEAATFVVVIIPLNQLMKAMSVYANGIRSSGRLDSPDEKREQAGRPALCAAFLVR